MNYTVVLLAVLALGSLLLLWLAVSKYRHRCRIVQPGGKCAPLADTKCLKDGFATRKLPAHIDAIIIGSGISGLYTAALLAKLGYKCVVLEQHDRAGGSTHTFEEEGFEFDTGLHYVGDVLGILLNAGTTGHIEWACTGEVTDEVVCGEERVEERRSGRRGLCVIIAAAAEAEEGQHFSLVYW